MKIEPRTDKTAVGFFIPVHVWPWSAYMDRNKQFQNRLPVEATIKGGATIKGDGFSMPSFPMSLGGLILSIPKLISIFFDVNFTGKQSLTTGMENYGF